MNKALVVIDVQNDFVPDNIIPNLINKVRENESNDVYYTMDIHQENEDTEEMKKFGSHCIEGTQGCAVVPRVRYILNRVKAIEVPKNTFCFTGNWKDIFRASYDEIEIVGVATDICVLNNALLLRSLYPYSRIIVDAACCAGTSLEHHQMALTLMKVNCIEIKNI